MQGPRLPPSPEAWSSQVPCPPMFWWWALYSQASSRRLLLATKGSRHLSSFGFSRSQRSSSSDIEAKGVGLHRNIYRYFELDVVFSAICHICISFICTDVAYNYIFDLHFPPQKAALFYCCCIPYSTFDRLHCYQRFWLFVAPERNLVTETKIKHHEIIRDPFQINYRSCK